MDRRTIVFNSNQPFSTLENFPFFHFGYKEFKHFQSPFKHTLMAPKQPKSKKAQAEKKKGSVEDKTFGLKVFHSKVLISKIKNKKGSKMQKYVGLELYLLINRYCETTG
jgi:hypothetical protein